jgi:hypothetical protein
MKPAGYVQGKPIEGNPSSKAKKTAKAEVAKPEKVTMKAMTEQLAPIANEVNVRFEKAAAMEGKADDHRLAAALKLADAKKKVEDAGLSFKSWVEKNIKLQSWENVRKLAVVGASGDPEKAALALADLRGKTKKAMQKHRDKKKASRDTSPKTMSVEEVLAAEKPARARKAIEKVGSDLGLVVMPKAEADALKQSAKTTPIAAEARVSAKQVADLGLMKQAFIHLSAEDKEDFVKFAADAIGAEVDFGEPNPAPKSGNPRAKVEAAKAAATDDDPLAVPDFLQRDRTTNRRKGASA